MPGKKIVLIEEQEFGVGVDIGNGTSTVVIETPSGVSSVKTIPTINMLGNYGLLKERRKGGMEAGEKKASYEDLVLKYKGRELFLGKMAAFFNDRPVLDIGDSLRYASEDSLCYVLALIAAQLHPSIRSFKARIVSSMPADWYANKPELREQVKKLYSGSHEFEFNEKPYNCELSYARTVMEGIGALTENGDLSSDHAVIDGGKLTTNMLRLRGTELQKSETLHEGADHIISGVVEDFQSTYGLELPYATREDLFFAYGAKISGRASYSYPTITFQGKEIIPAEFEPWLDIRTKHTADAMLKKASSTFDAPKGKIAGGVHKVYLVGGLMYATHKIIKEQIKHAVWVDNSETANARGNAKIALASLLKNPKK